MGEFFSSGPGSVARNLSALQAAIAGSTGKMVTLIRNPGSVYSVRTDLVDLERVANKEKPFPAIWMNASANDVLPAFKEYAAPLVGKIAPQAHLKKIFVRPVLG